MRHAGFSLIEVNMAVFVMAVGILSMATLFPLGLRESMQSQADIKQSMFADYVLNVAVATASSTNLTWTDWQGLASDNGSGKVFDQVFKAVDDYNANQLSGFKLEFNKTYAFSTFWVGGRYGDRILGMAVQSLDVNTTGMSDSTKLKALQKQPTYYAEARFQGSR